MRWAHQLHGKVATLTAALLLFLGGLVAGWPGTAAAHAHGEAAVRTVPIRTGAYRLVVSFYDDPPRVGRALAFSIDPAPGMSLPTGRLVVLASAVPGPGVNASPIRVPVAPHEDQPRGVAGTIHFPAPGPWTLRLEMLGPMGVARADVPLRVERAAAIPEWLGWAIGLVPVAALLGFIGVQIWHTWRAGGFRLD
jgi:hypothetical protein